MLQCFVPDYSTIHLKLFESFTLEYISAFKSLAPLTGIWYEHCPRQLPSWVRDRSALVHEANRFHMAQIDLYNHHYKASKDLLVVAVSCGNSMLRTHGIFVGTVTAVFTLASDLSGEVINKVLDYWRDDVRTRVGNVAFELSFWRTILGDAIPIDPSAPRPSPRSNIPRMRSVGPHDCEVCKSYYFTSDERARVRSPASNVAVGTATAYRRFFLTRKGEMGLAPPCTRPGDEVYVLHGGNVPFIVRTIGKKLREEGSLSTVYRVLAGDCFLDGIMFGQALESAHRSERAIILC